MNQLIEGMLPIGSRFAPHDWSSIIVHTDALPGDVLPIRFHIPLIKNGRTFHQAYLGLCSSRERLGKLGYGRILARDGANALKACEESQILPGNTRIPSMYAPTRQTRLRPKLRTTLKEAQPPPQVRTPSPGEQKQAISPAESKQQNGACTGRTAGAHGFLYRNS